MAEETRIKLPMPAPAKPERIKLGVPPPKEEGDAWEYFKRQTAYAYGENDWTVTGGMMAGGYAGAKAGAALSPVLGPFAPVGGAILGAIGGGLVGDFVSEDTEEDIKRKEAKLRAIEEVKPSNPLKSTAATAGSLITQAPLFVAPGAPAASAGRLALATAKATDKSVVAAKQLVPRSIGRFSPGGVPSHRAIGEKMLLGVVPQGVGFAGYGWGQGGEANEIAIDFAVGAAMGGWVHFGPGAVVPKEARLFSHIPQKSVDFLSKAAGETAILAMGEGAKHGEEAFNADTVTEIAATIIALRAAHGALGITKTASKPWIERTLKVKLGEEDGARALKAGLYQKIEKAIDESGVLNKMPEGFADSLVAGFKSISKNRLGEAEPPVTPKKGETGGNTGKPRKSDFLLEKEALAEVRRQSPSERRHNRQKMPLAYKIGRGIARRLIDETQALRYSTGLHEYTKMDLDQIALIPNKIKEASANLTVEANAVRKMSDQQITEYLKTLSAETRQAAKDKFGIPDVGATPAQWRDALSKYTRDKEQQGVLLDEILRLNKDEMEVRKIINAELNPRLSEIGKRFKPLTRDKILIDKVQKEMDAVIDTGTADALMALRARGAATRTALKKIRAELRREHSMRSDKAERPDRITLYRTMEPDLLARLQRGEVALLDARLAGGRELITGEGRALVRFEVEPEAIVAAHSDGLHFSFVPTNMKEGTHYRVSSPVKEASLRDYLDSLDYKDGFATKIMRSLNLDEIMRLPPRLTAEERAKIAENKVELEYYIPQLTRNHALFNSLIQIGDRFAGNSSPIGTTVTDYVKAHNGDGVNPFSGSNSMANTLFSPWNTTIAKFRWRLSFRPKLARTLTKTIDTLEAMTQAHSKEQAEIRVRNEDAQYAYQRALESGAIGVPKPVFEKVPPDLIRQTPEGWKDVRRLAREALLRDNPKMKDNHVELLVDAIGHFDALTRWMLDPKDPVINYKKYFPKQAKGEMKWSEMPTLLATTEKALKERGITDEIVLRRMEMWRKDMIDMKKRVYIPHMREGYFALSILREALPGKARRPKTNVAAQRNSRNRIKPDKFEPTPGEEPTVVTLQLFRTRAERDAAEIALKTAVANAKSGDTITLSNGETVKLENTRGLRVSASDMREATDAIRLSLDNGMALTLTKETLQRNIAALDREIASLFSANPKDVALPALRKRRANFESAIRGTDELMRADLIGGKFTNRFKTRNNTPGYEQDALRAYGDYALTAGRYLARTYHSASTEGAIAHMDNIVKGLQNGTFNGRKISPETSSQVIPQVERIRDWMERHYRDTTNPLEESALIKGAMFNWFFAGVPRQFFAAAAQVPMVAFPYLGARYGDAAAVKSLALASKDLARFMFHSDKSHGPRGSKPLDSWELMMRDLGIQFGFLTQNQQVELGRARERTYQNRIKSTVLYSAARGIDFLTMHFTIAERMSREVTFLSSIRLEAHRQWRAAQDSGAFKGSFKDYMREVQTNSAFSRVRDEIFNSGKKAVQDTMFEYSAFNRPEMFRGKVKSVIFLFQTFTQHMLHLLYTDRASTRMLASLVMVAGLSGLPFAEDFFNVMDAISQQFYPNQPIDWKAEVMNLMNEAGGDPIAWMYGAGRVGPADWVINAFNTAGVDTPRLDAALERWDVGKFGDISTSLGLGRIAPSLEPVADTLQFGSYADIPSNLVNAIIGFAGPIGSPTQNIGRLLVGGEAVPTLDLLGPALPTGLKNLTQAFDLTFPEVTREGVRAQGYVYDKKGAVRTEVTGLEVAALATGFTPDPLKRHWETSNLNYSARLYMAGRRLELYTLLKQAIDYKNATDDDRLLKERIRQIRGFNDSVRQQGFNGMQINRQMITAAMRSRFEDQYKTTLGLPRNKKEFMFQQTLYDKLWGEGAYREHLEDRKHFVEALRPRAQKEGATEGPIKEEPVPRGG